MRHSHAIARRSLLAALPLVAIGSARSRAAQFTLKLATGQSIGQPINTRLEQTIGRIQKASGGRLAIRFFPASQLGSDTDLLSQIRNGGVDFLNIAGSVLSTVAPVAALNNVGFAFNNADNIWKSMDGALGSHIRGEIEKSGMLVMAKPGDNGIRQITSSATTIAAPGDLKGYRIRVPVSPIFTSLFTSLGANPTSINFNELYTALQTHLVDGEENGLVTIDAGKLYEVQKHVAETSHIWDSFWLLGNRRSVSALPADLQQMLHQEFDRAMVEQRADNAALDATLKAQLTAKGMSFNTVDRPAFRKALAQAGFYKEWRGKFGAENWRMLENAVGALG
ncbi:MAG: TRAP transporter substrate-binding protein [Rhodospirillales bacterium]|nr:TRAP transporter substrate-binding protein [Rhodospirillales bacterium]